MTEYTRSLVRKFLDSGDLNDFCSVLINIHSDDAPGTAVPFRNNFATLRNLAAHQGADMVNELLSPMNRRQSKFVFTNLRGTDGVIRTVVFEWLQFIIIFYSMYLQKGEEAYLVLAKSVAIHILGVMPKAALPLAKRDALIKQYYDFDSALQTAVNRPKQLNVGDPWIKKIIDEDPRQFWRIVFSDFAQCTTLYAASGVRDRTTVEMFVSIYKQRDGKMKEAVA